MCFEYAGERVDFGSLGSLWYWLKFWTVALCVYLLAGLNIGLAFAGEGSFIWSFRNHK